MIVIAHRGNVDGVNSLRENSPSFIDEALDLGFHCEIDLRVKDGRLFLGHDEPQCNISKDWLFDRRDVVFIHCKDSEALEFLFKELGRDTKEFNIFWHDKDDYTITTSGLIWAYPGSNLLNIRCISVMPESIDNSYVEKSIELCYGVCTDYAVRYARYI